MNSWVFSFLLKLVNDRSSCMPSGRWLYMDGAATEKHRSTRVSDLATVRGTVSCGMLLNLRVLPTARLVTKS